MTGSNQPADFAVPLVTVRLRAAPGRPSQMRLSLFAAAHARSATIGSLSDLTPAWDNALTTTWRSVGRHCVLRAVLAWR